MTKAKETRNAEREMARVEAQRKLMCQRHDIETSLLHEKGELMRSQLAERQHLEAAAFEVQWGMRPDGNGHGAGAAKGRRPGEPDPFRAADELNRAAGAVLKALKRRPKGSGKPSGKAQAKAKGNR